MVFTVPGCLSFHANHLFVGNDANTVSEYLSGGSTPLREITQGLRFPRAFAFDHLGNLYVANSALAQRHIQHNGSVSVYAPGSKAVLRTITAGVRNPLALAIGATGNLFVANFEANTVTVYAAGSANVLRTLDTKYAPRALAIGRDGYVYVGETQLIEVFAPGGTVPVRSIQQGGWALTWGDT